MVVISSSEEEEGPIKAYPSLEEIVKRATTKRLDIDELLPNPNLHRISVLGFHDIRYIPDTHAVQRHESALGQTGMDNRQCHQYGNINDCRKRPKEDRIVSSALTMHRSTQCKIA